MLPSTLFRPRLRSLIVEHPVESVRRVECYQEDGRQSLEQLYRAYMQLSEEYGWTMEGLYCQTQEVSEEESMQIPVLSFRTESQGPALWVLSGIHGEEPAGPNAIAENIEFFAELGKQGVPMVVIPLCNPKGYSLNWRFPNTADRKYKSEDNPHGGTSVGEADWLTRGVLKLSQTHPPLLVLDHHEDELVPGCYIYVQWTGNAKERMAREILTVIQGAGIPLNTQDTTRFGEPIVDGVVALDEAGHPVQDGSIDDLLSSPRIYVDGVWRTGPSAPHAFVIETPAKGPLSDRMQTHTAVFQALPKLWGMART